MMHTYHNSKWNKRSLFSTIIALAILSMHTGIASAELHTGIASAGRPSFASLQAQIESLQAQIDQIPGIPTFAAPTCEDTVPISVYYPSNALTKCTYCTDCLIVVNVGDSEYALDYPQSDLLQADCGYQLRNSYGRFHLVFDFTGCDSSSNTFEYMETYQNATVRVWSYE